MTNNFESFYTRFNAEQGEIRYCLMNNFSSSRRQLLSIEEAWNLPISAEMTSRQQQQSANQQTRTGSQSLVKSYSQGPPPPYPSPGSGAIKRFKPDTDQKPTPPYLNPQQMQTLQYLQSHPGTLTPQQQVIYLLKFLLTVFTLEMIA